MLGFFSSKLLSAIFKALSLFLRFTAAVLTYFGLYVPFLYLIYGGCIYLALDVPLFDLEQYSLMYLIGLALCLVCSVIISVRNFVTEPLAKRFERANKVVYSGKRGKNTPPAPTIYFSKVNRGIIVYEYDDRYDLYENRGGRLFMVDSQPKERSRSFWR